MTITLPAWGAYALGLIGTLWTIASVIASACTRITQAEIDDISKKNARLGWVLKWARHFGMDLWPSVVSFVKIFTGAVHFVTPIATLLLALFLAPTITGCTAAQWKQFQTVNAQVDQYAINAEGTLNVVMDMVLLATGDNAIVATVRGLVIAAEMVLDTETQVVVRSATALDTPAQIAAAFPRFIAAWDQIANALANSHLNVPSVPSVSASGEIGVHASTQWPVPRIVLAALPQSLPTVHH